MWVKVTFTGTGSFCFTSANMIFCFSTKQLLVVVRLRCHINQNCCFWMVSLRIFCLDYSISQIYLLIMLHLDSILVCRKTREFFYFFWYQRQVIVFVKTTDSSRYRLKKKKWYPLVTYPVASKRVIFVLLSVLSEKIEYFDQYRSYIQNPIKHLRWGVLQK